MIAVGNINASKVYLGSEEISKIYLGSTQIWGGSSLPYDAQVEYLSGDGSAYINTLIEGTSNTIYDVSLRITESTYGAGIGFVWGARVANKNKSTGLFIYNLGGTGNYERGFGWRWGNTEAYKGFDPLWGDYTLTNKAANRTLVINGSNLSCTNTTFSSGYNVYIFGCNNGGTFTGNPNLQYVPIFSFKIYNGSTLVRDFIPVRVGTVGYFYDNVSKQLFGNANSSGSFILGPDKTT